MITLKQYRDPWLFETVNEVIGFYPPEFFVFDNFSSFGIFYENRYYRTVEHAYQSLSFRGYDDNLADRIMHEQSAHEAQKTAYANKDKRRPDWDEVKVSIMEKLLRAKIEQNPYVLQKLMQTENYPIVENSPKDSFWGWGPNRDGQNQLGKLWMKLRDEIRTGGIK